MKAIRDKIDLSIHFMTKIGINTKYGGLAQIELERANNWVTQLYHISKLDYPSHDQTGIEFPEDYSKFDYIKDNRKRIQDTVNELVKLSVSNPQVQMISMQIMTALMEAKMWLGNQLDMETKIQALSGGSIAPSHTDK